MTPDHGTRARYSRVCRCDSCRGANAAYDRALRARAGLRSRDQHLFADSSLSDYDEGATRLALERSIEWLRTL